jgi:hypothetical protein
MTNNYARDDMVLTPTQTIADDASDKNGANVSAAQLQDSSWWTSTSGGPGWTIGTSGGSESAPWVWNASVSRPKLWFE